MYHKAKAHFKKADPILHKAAESFDIEDLAPSDDLFTDIVWTIIGQQLSGRAADTIFERFRKLFPKGIVTAKKILALPDAEMRKCGLSGAKARAIRSLAEHIVSGKIRIRNLSTLSDDEVMVALTQVKGIGPWTAQMILMSSLARTDVFSAGDLGLRKGMMHLYGLSKMPSEKKMNALTAVWSPYRTYASRVLWKVADEKKKKK